MTADTKPLPERFDCTNGNTPWCQGCYTMTPDEYGDYVQWEDYERITAAQAAEIERLRAVRDSFQRVGIAAQARAERLAEALRELVEVFSESGMYDEEVFAKARAALRDHDQEVGNG